MMINSQHKAPSGNHHGHSHVLHQRVSFIHKTIKQKLKNKFFLKNLYNNMTYFDYFVLFQSHS